MNSLWQELKQRRVVRVTIAYAVVAYAAVQAASTFFPALRMPDWTVTLVAVLALIGLPVAIALSWIFQVTPEGITRTPSTRERPLTAGAIAVVGAVIVLGVAAGAFLLLPRGGTADGKNSTAFDRKRVLVAPFADNTGDPALAAVGRMAADWLTQGLIQASIGEVVE